MEGIPDVDKVAETLEMFRCQRAMMYIGTSGAYIHVLDRIIRICERSI